MDKALVDAVQRVKDLRDTRKLLPTEKDFIGRPGYERKYNRDGSGRYKWRFRFRPNVDGKWTKEGAEVLERMRPFWKKDNERHQKNEAKKERAAMRDRDGRVQYVDPHLADKAAERNGWGHFTHRSRNVIETGPDGMLWKWLSGGWYPTGRWCLSTPYSQKNRPKGGKSDGSINFGVQHDPNGTPWRFVGGEWQSL